MADSYVQVPADSSGKKIDAASLDVGVNTVQRQRIILADNSATATYATCLASTPAGTEGALVVRNIPSGTQTVTGAVGLSGTAVCQITSSVNLNISAMPAVALAAGSANIGTINGISATVTVINAAGTANIGSINNISAPVVLAAGSANIGSINNISATVTVAGTVNVNGGVAISGTVVLAAGSANIGSINNISATVNCGLSYVVEKTTNSQVQVGDSANAAIRVNIVAGAVGGTGGTSMADRATYTEGAALMTPSGAVFSDTRSAVAEDAAAALRITNQAGLHVNLRTDGGVKMDDSANTALRVNVVAGSAGGPSSNDNTTFSTGATPLAPAGFIFFSASATTVTDGRVAAARITDSRAVHMNLRNNAGTEIGTTTTPISVKVENVSATASVVLAAGTANIGTINNISAAVAVTIAAALNISAMPAVALAAGSANIGSINNISATVTVAFGNIALTSVSHGPTCVTASTSAVVTLIASPGAGQSVYVTSLAITNMGTVNTLTRVGTSASTGAVLMGAASAGGGYVLNFSPPWKLSASEACVCSVKPNSSGNVYFNVNFYVAP